jgi:hypothetical protein
VADEIRQEHPKVLAQITITLVGLPSGMSNTDITCGGEQFHEIHARFLMDKARAFLDDHWRQANAPRIAPPSLTPQNGYPIANQIRRPIG